MTRERAGVTVPDLKAGMGVVAELFGRARKPVPVRSRRGEILARIVPEPEFSNPGIVVEPVDGETFRKRRVTYLYGSYWGRCWLVQQRGGNFVVFPPEGRQLVNAASVATKQDRSAEPVVSSETTNTAELVHIVVDLAAKIGVLEGRLAAIENRYRHRGTSRARGKASVSPAP